MIYKEFEKYNVEFTYSCILIGIEKYCLEIEDIKLFIGDMLYIKENIDLELEMSDLIKENSLEDIKNLLIKKNLNSKQIDEYKYWYIYLKKLEECIEVQNEEWQPFAEEHRGFYNIITTLSSDRTIHIDDFLIDSNLNVNDKINRLKEYLEKTIVPLGTG